MIKEEAIAVLESDVEYLYSQDSPYCRQAYQMAIEALKSEPTKQGRWETEITTNKDGTKSARYACSVCGVMALDEWHYCPNCGADMRGEQNG